LAGGSVKTVNIFFHGHGVWKNAVGDMARRLAAGINATDIRIIFGTDEHDGDLVHYQCIGPAAQGVRPGLMSIHQLSPRMPGRRLEDVRPALRRHLGIVVLTATMAEQVRGATDHPVYVVPGGYDDVRFTPAPMEARLDRVVREPFTVGLVGHNRHRDFDTKGGEAVEAVMRLCPDYRYRICGSGWGAVETRHQGEGRDIKVFQPHYDDMPKFYRGLDVLLCLSREEGGCLPILEALACGVPVVSTRVGYAMLDLTSVVRRVDFVGDDCLADAEQVGNELMTLAANRETTTRHANRIAAEVGDFTWQRYADRHAVIYRELLSNA
jgi:glycosyltransferase involved in cell wall biosynthesis